MVPLGSHTLGHPAWLIDWHDRRAYAWLFTMEGNCHIDNIALAYILRVACTPFIGHIDKDDWQVFPMNGVPESTGAMRYERVMPQQFFGICEVCQIKKGTNWWPLRTDFGSSSLSLLDPHHGAVKEEMSCSSKSLRIGETSEDGRLNQNGHTTANGGKHTEEARLSSPRG